MFRSPKILDLNADTKTRLATCYLTIAISLSSPTVFAANATWVAGAGNWLDNVLFWSGGVFPSAGDDIFITDPNLEQRLVVAGISPSINSLTINANNLGLDPDEFHIVNSRSVTVGSPGIINHGVISLNAALNTTSLIFQGSSTINGTGSITMTNSLNNIVRNAGSAEVFSLGSSATISGAGRLVNNIGGMINNGTIIADQTQQIVIDTNGLGFAQGGVLRATGTGGLFIQNTPLFTNTNGIDIEAGSKLDVFGSTIVGGEINIDPSASTTFRSNTNLDGLTINGNVTHNNNETVNLFNGLTLNGQWNMNAGINTTNLLFHGPETLTGVGTVNLSNSLNNIIRSNSSADILTIDEDIIIQGAGRLVNNIGGMINNGTIIADQTQQIVIDTNSQGFAQNGILRATGSGGLFIQNTPLFTNTNGIDIEAGSKLDVFGSTIVGGEIDIDPSASTTFRGNSNLDGLTINGNVTHNNNETVNLFNGLTLNGQWNMNAGINTTNLLFHGSETLTGVGTVNLSNSLNNIIRSNSSADILTIDGDIIIQGAGRLVNNIGGMINNGTIIADQAQQIVIDTNNQGFTQNGILRATGSGGLFIQNTPLFTNTNGIDIEAGSKLDVFGSTIVGGEINIDPSASTTFRGNTNLDGLTINGNVTHNNIETVNLFNGLTLNGQWNMNAGINTTNLLFHGPETLTGIGTLNLSNSLNNIIRSNSSADILTIDEDIIIQGAGRLVNNIGGMINNGTIIADQTQQIVIDTNSQGFAQNGILRATGSGGLFIQNTPTFTNTNGINIEAGSKLDVFGSTIVGGEINIDPTASTTFRGNTNLDGLTINGNVTHNNIETVNLFNGLTLNGQWNMNAGINTTNLLFHGSETLTGVGTVNLSNSLNNIIRSNSSADILTIDEDIIIQGAGRLVNNIGGMINNGTIIADQTQQIIIDANNLGFENRGQLTASGAQGLQSVGGYSQTAGVTTVNSILEITQNGELSLEGGLLNGAGLIVGDVNNTGGTVNAGNSPGTLTIDGDYSQSSTGNLLIEIAGISAGQFDTLDISGTANLGGTIEVSLLGNPAISINDTFDVLIASEILGAFDNGTVTAGGASFAVTIIDGLSSDIVRLTATSAVPIPGAVWMLISGILVLLSKRRASPIAK